MILSFRQNVYNIWHVVSTSSIQASYFLSRCTIETLGSYRITPARCSARNPSILSVAKGDVHASRWVANATVNKVSSFFPPSRPRNDLIIPRTAFSRVVEMDLAFVCSRRNPLQAPSSCAIVFDLLPGSRCSRRRCIELRGRQPRQKISEAFL